MPLEGLEEEGLPKNPDLSLAHLKFLVTVEGEDRESIWSQLLTAVKENGIKRIWHSLFCKIMKDS